MKAHRDPKLLLHTFHFVAYVVTYSTGWKHMGTTRLPGICRLVVCVHLDVDGFVTISEQSWRSFWKVWSVAE